MRRMTPFLDQRFVLVTFAPHRYVQHKMQPIATVVSVCACLLFTSVSSAKTAEPIENRLWTRRGDAGTKEPRNSDPAPTIRHPHDRHTAP